MMQTPLNKFNKEQENMLIFESIIPIDEVSNFLTTQECSVRQYLREYFCIHNLASEIIFSLICLEVAWYNPHWLSYQVFILHKYVSVTTIKNANKIIVSDNNLNAYITIFVFSVLHSIEYSAYTLEHIT